MTGCVLLVSCVTTCLLLTGLEFARAETGQALDALGAGLANSSAQASWDGARTLHLNGATIRVTSGSSDRPIEVVQAHFLRRCRERSPLPDAAGGRAPVIARLGPRRGHVACLRAHQVPRDLGEAADLLQQTLLKGDLDYLGNLEVVFLNRDDTQTSYLALQAVGPWNVQQMFPSGDAPGLDPEGLPRPPLAVRRLCAWQEQRRPGLTVYESHGNLGEVRTAHEESLRNGGWRLQDLPGQSHSLLVSQDQRELIVTYGAKGGVVTTAVTRLQ